jgi:hypothetical protein
LKAVHHISASSAEINDAFHTGFDSVKVQPPHRAVAAQVEFESRVWKRFIAF